MQNNINSNFSFRANIEPFVRISNPERFANIRKLFMAATKDMPKDTLYLSKPEGREVLSAHIIRKNVDVKAAVDSDEIITASLDDHMNYMTDEQIVNKFIAFLKVLVSARRARSSLGSVDSEINKAKKLIKDYKIKIENVENEKIRSMYKALMDRKYKTLAELTQRRNISFNDFREQQELLAKQYPEVRNVDVI